MRTRHTDTGGDDEGDAAHDPGDDARPGEEPPDPRTHRSLVTDHFRRPLSPADEALLGSVSRDGRIATRPVDDDPEVPRR